MHLSKCIRVCYRFGEQSIVPRRACDRPVLGIRDRTSAGVDWRVSLGQRERTRFPSSRYPRHRPSNSAATGSWSRVVETGRDDGVYPSHHPLDRCIHSRTHECGMQLVLRQATRIGLRAISIATPSRLVNTYSPQSAASFCGTGTGNGWWECGHTGVGLHRSRGTVKHPPTGDETRRGYQRWA